MPRSLALLIALVTLALARPRGRSARSPSASASATSRSRCSTSRLPAREVQARPLLHRLERDGRRRPRARRPRLRPAARARTTSRSCCTSRPTTCASRRPSCRPSRVPPQGRAARALLPRPRRPRVRRLERGQPRQPAHLPQPDARGRLLPRDVPRGQGHCRSCAVVALDVLDQAGVERYMRSFYRHLSATYRRRATLVGIHNYGDVNRKRTTFTRNIIQPGAPLQPPHAASGSPRPAGS